MDSPNHALSQLLLQLRWCRLELRILEETLKPCSDLSSIQPHHFLEAMYAFQFDQDDALREEMEGALREMSGSEAVSMGEVGHRGIQCPPSLLEDLHHSQYELFDQGSSMDNPYNQPDDEFFSESMRR